jgi:hypothetical protein
MDPKLKFHMLSKEDLLVCAFYKLEYLSCLAAMLPKFWKSFYLLNLVLVLIEPVVKKQGFLTSLSCSRKFLS